MIEQVGIAIFGITGIALANLRSPEARKWAPIFGLVGQVFWFWSSYVAEQWGIFFMSFVYTGAWMVGLYNQWCLRKLVRKWVSSL